MKTQSFVSITLVVLVLSVFISCSEQKKEHNSLSLPGTFGMQGILKLMDSKPVMGRSVS
mgnify:CR=1 FL=1